MGPFPPNRTLLPSRKSYFRPSALVTEPPSIRVPAVTASTNADSASSVGIEKLEGTLPHTCSQRTPVRFCLADPWGYQACKRVWKERHPAASIGVRTSPNLGVQNSDGSSLGPAGNSARAH